jgi:signal transduction histidine kinase
MPSPGVQSQESPAARRGVTRRRLPRWHDLPLRIKGLAVIGIPVVPLLGIALVFVTMQGVQRRAEAQVTHTHDVKEAVSAALISLLDAESSARGFVLTGHRTWLEPYERVRRELPGQFSRIQALVSDNPLSIARIGRIRALAEARLSAITSLLPYPNPAYPPESLLLGGHRLMEALRLEVTAMEEYENGLLAERRARLEGARRKTQMLIGVAAGLGMAGGLCGAWLFAGGVARRVERVKDTAERLAHGQPLIGAVSVDEDEVGHLDRRLHDTAVLLDQRAQDLNVARKELEARVAELANVNLELEAFSYSVSHDLRAPLRHVTGFASLLEQQAGSTLDAQARRYLTTITEAARRMGTLIDDLLAFSRMGRTNVVKRSISLSELLDEARAEVSVDLNGRRIVWDVQPLPTVEADPALLRSALVNLLSNAVKYTSTRDEARIEVGTVASAGEVVVFVRDNGVGFDMAYAHKLFGVFQRLHRSDEFIGTGIGLANVRRIVQRHGGRTWAEGAIDSGATFYFSLPLGTDLSFSLPIGTDLSRGAAHVT